MSNVKRQMYDESHRLLREQAKKIINSVRALNHSKFTLTDEVHGYLEARYDGVSSAEVQHVATNLKLRRLSVNMDDMRYCLEFDWHVQNSMGEHLHIYFTDTGLRISIV